MNLHNIMALDESTIVLHLLQHSSLEMPTTNSNKGGSLSENFSIQQSSHPIVAYYVTVGCAPNMACDKIFKGNDFGKLFFKPIQHILHGLDWLQKGLFSFELHPFGPKVKCHQH
eukprot:scpid51629/ scgid11738/ 